MKPSITEGEIKNEIVRIAKVLFDRQLISALGGNISGRVPGSNEFWITPSQVFKGALRPDDLVKVTLEGDVIEGSHKPSIEWLFHAAIYKVRPDVNGVVHAHNPMVLGLTLAGREIKASLTGEATLILRKIEKVPFKPPGTRMLADEVAKVVSRGASAVILENHGVIGLGSSLLEAETIVELLEELATIEFVCYALGKEPREISLDKLTREESGGSSIDE